MRSSIKKHRMKGVALYCIIFFQVLIMGYLINRLVTSGTSFRETQQTTPLVELEIAKIRATNSVPEQEKWYLKLIERVGPEEAQEILQRSGIPYTGQAHLLNHTVGNYIFKKFGPKGITKCKDYFSSSCFHGLVIDAIGGGNLDNVEIMMNECEKKGKPPFDQCAHAVGHGFLAWIGYANLLKALTLCDDMAPRVKGFNLGYCHNGVFMENIWGLHEGKPSADRWISKTDLWYPCTDPRIDQKYLPGCWYNQAFEMNKVLKGDRLKVAAECYKVPHRRNQEECFDGIFRGIAAQYAYDLDKKFSICEQMPGNWAVQCVITQAGALIQQGDRNYAFQVCQRSNPETISKCYQLIQHQMKYYNVTPNDYSHLCSKIPLEFRITECSKIRS